MSEDCKFQDYGETFGNGDVIGAYVVCILLMPDSHLPHYVWWKMCSCKIMHTEYMTCYYSVDIINLHPSVLNQSDTPIGGLLG